MFVASVTVAALLAQPPSPSRDPVLTGPGVEQRRSEQQRKALNTEPIAPQALAPAQSPIPGLAPPRGVTLTVAGRARHAEGSFVAPIVGHLRRASTGDIIFEPDVPAQGPREPTFILMPCATLAEVLIGDEAGPAAIGGQVFEYRGRPYLLPTTVLRDLAPTGEPDADPPPADPDPSASDLIRDLESGAVPRTILPLDDSARRGGDAGAVQGDDGQLIVHRRARIVRLPGAAGRFAATFDNDPDSPADKPMVLLPCRTLERLEATASFRGEQAAYRVSGRVYRFDGQAYLLPVLVQVERQSDVTPLQ